MLNWVSWSFWTAESSLPVVLPDPVDGAQGKEQGLPGREELGAVEGGEDLVLLDEAARRDGRRPS